MLSCDCLIKGVFFFTNSYFFPRFFPIAGVFVLEYSVKRCICLSTYHGNRQNTPLQGKSLLYIVYDVTDVIPNYSGLFFQQTIE